MTELLAWPEFCPVDTRGVSSLLELLSTGLERPRTVSPQVTHHLVGTYGIPRDGVREFLTNRLAALEDYEIDLLLSSLFTPTLEDQAAVADWLGRESQPASDWPGLVEQLVARPTRAQLVMEDQQVLLLPLRAVTIERFVHRLRLDATIPGPLFDLINRFPTVDDRPLLKAIARRAAWERPARSEILVRYLSNAAEKATYRLEDAVGLLKLQETYESVDVNELLARIPHWQSVLRQEINEGSHVKPFFNERVEELHGGGRDQRRQDRSRVAALEGELSLLDRLQRILAD